MSFLMKPKSSWYSVPSDPVALARLVSRCREFVTDPDTQNLYGCYLLCAIEELVWLRADRERLLRTLDLNTEVTDG